LKKIIKIFDPSIDEKDERAVLKVMRSHLLGDGFGGEQVEKFEKEYNDYIGSQFCVATHSGTSSLHLALSLANLKDKEVIVPSISFVSTAHAVLFNGGKPVFVDLDPKTLLMDPNVIEEKITSKTKVILPVHLGGLACDLDKINRICKKHDILLMEDAAHANGTIYKNKKIGSYGAAVCHSFNPTKSLPMPNGGAVTLNGKKAGEFRKILQSRRWVGHAEKIGAKYDIRDLGWNYFMNEISATMGRVQLKKLDKMNKRRSQVAKRYFDEIKIQEKMPYVDDCSYHLFWLLVKNRDQFMINMKKAGVQTGIHYRPIHKMTFYGGKVKLPNTEYAGEHVVSLPMHPNLTESDVDTIIKSANKYAISN